MSSGRRTAPPHVRSAARGVLEAHWREPGFTCPNATTYPWLWLWDSCFHSIVWAELGDARRAVSELTLALGAQDDEGFVPHLQYLDRSTVHEDFWGRPATSSITQPPIHALTVAELTRRDVEVPDEVVQRSVRALHFLLERRRRSPAGLIEIVHPWESGCDDSPRWDDLMAPEFDTAVWVRRKGELLDTVTRSPGGAPLHNDGFPVGSAAFTAITAWCARQLAEVSGERCLIDGADELADALARRWDPVRRTFVDDGPTAAGSGRIRTAEALLGSLVVRDDEILAAVADELCDPDAYAGAFGPAQVHRDEPSFTRNSYWRGPSWPQLDLLLWHALGGPGVDSSAADGGGADELAAATCRGALRSGWAEYWDPDDATPGGAVPQSWATVALLLPWPTELCEMT